MVSKEGFNKAIIEIKRENRLTDMFCDTLNDLGSGEGYCCLYDQSTSVIFDLITEGLSNDNQTLLLDWIFYKDLFKEDGHEDFGIIVNDGWIPLNNNDQMYDFLFKE